MTSITGNKKPVRWSKRSTRIEACRLAARAMQGNCDGPCADRLWSLCVFFENYIDGGAAATQEDFGYKDPVNLREAGKQS
jgi:hypothetical protein